MPNTPAALPLGEYELYINKVLNPVGVDSSGRFGVFTLYADAVVDQNQDFGSVTFSAAPRMNNTKND